MLSEIEKHADTLHVLPLLGYEGQKVGLFVVRPLYKEIVIGLSVLHPLDTWDEDEGLLQTMSPYRVVRFTDETWLFSVWGYMETRVLLGELFRRVRVSSNRSYEILTCNNPASVHALMCRVIQARFLLHHNRRDRR